MNERSVLAPALAGRYEIEREIGRGGMAVVFLAHDVKHSRRVAIKVVGAELGAVLGADRFLSEIRVTANLHHPNILPLFDSGEAAGLLYYVMPFVDGESLRARLDRERQLPVDEALRIAAAIAGAVQHAHENGVVHRDLKPENILLQSGQPVVADFGIALAVSNAGGARATQTGMSLGTPQYMSPEQATGDRIIDARSDVYSLGAITYEMLVGEPPHTGATSQAIIARILTERPRSVRESRASVPEHVDFAIARALEKLPADRFATAKEFADALQGRIASGPVTSASRRATRPSQTALLGVGVASLVAVAASVGWWRSAHVPPPAVHRYVVNLPAGVTVGGGGGQKVAMSHDGQSLAFSSSDTRLFVRRLDQLEPTQFPKAQPAGPEFHFSEDGKWLTYWNHGPYRIPIGPAETGVEPTRLVELPSRGQVVYFGSELIYLFQNKFWSVPAGGGPPRKLASMDTTVDASWLHPVMLSDGKTIAFSVGLRAAKNGDETPPRLALISADSGSTRTVLELEASGIVGNVDGILIFTRPAAFGRERLFAVKFDVGKRKVLGAPVELVADRITNRSGVAVSDNGTLAYIAVDAPSSKVEIVDTLGNVTASLPNLARYHDALASPDGKRIALTIADGAQSDISVYNVETGVTTPLTHTGGDTPRWTLDSKRVAYSASNGSFWMPVDGSAPAEPIPGTAALGPSYWLSDLSGDGKYIILGHAVGGLRPVIAPPIALPFAGGEPITLLEGAEAPQAWVVSPNAKWIAYESREAGGKHQVFIRSFPSGPAKVQLSTEGGDDPQWSPDGRKLFYRRADKEFRVATLDFSGAAPRVVRTDVLFANRDLAERPIATYSVHPDGKHFVVTRPVGDGARLVVVENWIAEVRAKLAGK
jgi:serine/threonine-protein kinase